MADNKFNYIYIECEAQNTPDFKPVRNGEYIKYGKENNYPNYIIDLYQRCAENNAIINAKANFVFGKGLSYKKTNDLAIDSKLEKFIANANRYETWNDLLPKPILNFELIDGFYFQHIFGKNGKIVSTYNMDMTRIRKGTEGGFWYCEDWSDDKKVREKVWYPEYSEHITEGSCIQYCKITKPAVNRYGDTYSVPGYIGALNAIETDINVDVFFNSLTQNGMTAQGMLTLYNGEPSSEDEAKEIEKQFKKKFTGAKKAGGFMLNFADANGKAAELTNFSTSDLDKQYEILSKRNLQKITSGHRIDPILIGIDTATSWTRTNILDKWERFNTEYVRLRQEKVLEAIKVVADSQGVAFEQLYFEPLPPLGEELELGESTFNEVLTVEEKRNYLRDKKGVELSSIDDEQATSRLSIAQKLGIGGTASLQAIIVDPSMQPDQKLNIMTGLYGVPEKKARKMLGMLVLPVAMSETKDPILEALLACAIDDNDDEIIEEKFVDSNFNFEEVLGVEVKNARNIILDLLAGDPFVKLEIIAKQIGTDVDYVKEQIAQMQEAKILETSGKGFNITDKGLKRAENVDPIIETEIYTVYKYALSPNSDYKNAKGYIETSHPFCKEMMSMSGKSWTRENIDSITNDFDQNVWVYRGGWTGHKNSEPTQYCNHVWKAITKTRKRGSNG